MMMRQLEIRDFILTLARTHFGVSNEMIASLFQKYAYNTILPIDILKTEIQKELLYLARQSIPSGDDLFVCYGITSPQSLLEFIVNNHEIGFLNIQSVDTQMIPLGGLHGISSKNKITNYDDSRIVQFLQDYYEKIPLFYKRDNSTLSDILDISSQHLLQKNWRLQDPYETLKYMVGTYSDFLEVAVLYFENLGYKVKRYSFSSIRNAHENHLFIAYCKENTWYYFEPFFIPFIGIHEFKSLKELETMVYSKFMTYYTTSCRKKLISLKEYNGSELEKYQRALLYRDKAIYDYRLSLSNDEDVLHFQESSYEKWMESISLFQQLPRAYEYYELKCLRDVAIGSNYYEYQSYLFYQKKSKYLQESRKIYEIEQGLLQMVVRGILIPGIISLEEGVFTFQKVEFPTSIRILEHNKKEEQIIARLREHLFMLVYDTNSFSRSVMRLSSEGLFIQIKGIDLLDSRSSTHQYPLLQMKQHHALQITPDGMMRFRGICSYFSLYTEKILQEKLHAIQLLVPDVINITEYSTLFLEKYKLPFKQESAESYITRTGLKNKVEDSVIDKFLNDNSRGLWFGQIQRKILSPFRISDLSYYLERGEVEHIKDILEFSRLFSSENSGSLSMYLLQFANTLGKQLSILFQHNYYYKWNDLLDDITLAGEFCDDKVASFYEEMQNVEDNCSLSVMDNEKRRIRLAYFLPFLALTKSLEVILACGEKISGKNISNSVMTIFVGRFLGGLSIEKQEEFFAFYKTFDKKLEFSDYLELFPEKCEFLRENRLLFRDMFDIVNKFIESPEYILKRAKTIMKDQEFFDNMSSIDIATKFVNYLKERFSNEKVNVDDLNIDYICNDSKMGTLIRGEAIMLQTISALQKYNYNSLEFFCELGYDLITLEESRDSKTIEDIQRKLSSHLRKNKNTQLIILNNKDEVLPVEIFVPIKKLTSVSGTASPICLLFTLLGSSFLVLGIIMAFFL